MENVILSSIHKSLLEFMAIPNGPMKNYKFSQRSTSLTSAESNITYKDGCMYYSKSNVKVLKSKHGYFLRRDSKEGFTLDEKGKLQIWYNKQPKKLTDISTVIKHLGNDWFLESYLPYLTKGILEKILNGKITNPLGFFEAWLKAQRIKASPRLVYKATVVSNPHELQYLMLKYQNCFEHMDQFLLKLIDDVNDKGRLHTEFTDLCDQAIIMEMKVDPMWSEKRCEIEHQKLTKLIMEMEIDSIDNERIEGLEELKEFIDSPFITLLDNKRAVFMEGKLMSHCIYTNYWTRISQKDILCLHVNYKGHEGTLTLTRPTRSYRFELFDFKSKRNASPDVSMSRYVYNWLESFNNRLTLTQFKLNKESVVSEERYSDQWIAEPLPF